MKKYSKAFVFLLIVTAIFPCRGLSQTDALTKFEKSSLKGTPGYFRVGKTGEGQWWFITPGNQLFYYRGICAINRAGGAGGRFAGLTKYAETVDMKYNYQQSPDNFINACIQKVHGLGFNAFGAWTTEEFFNKGVPFTEIMEFFKEGPFLPQAGNKRGLPDIFDPKWVVAIDKNARALCSPLRYSEDLIGYFTDNEIGFGKADDFGLDPGFQAGQFDFSLLRVILGMESGKPAFEYTWDFLLKRYDNSFEKLSKAWDVKISSKDDIRKLNENKTKIPGEAYSTDARAFVKRYAEKYFKLTNKAIRRYDPNHLILGCRFGGPPPTDILDAIKPWTDVISANNYQPTLYERYDTVYQYTGLPLLIGEFSWNTDPYKVIPFSFEPEKKMSVKERMFLKGEETLLRTARHDGIVGFTWYRWVQGTCTDNRFFDGIVNYGDSLEMHCGELGKLLPTLEKVRMDAANGLWKKAPVNNGEMTLFPNRLRPNWDHYLRIGFVAGKPEVQVYGWKMKGKVLKFSKKQNLIYVKLEVIFEEATGISKNYEGGKGIYEIKLMRSGEKFYGNFTGTYNGSPVRGNVKAFYFPKI